MTKTKGLGLAVLVCALQATSVIADTTCPMNYEAFEVGVPHTDLETCPASMAADGTYCRLSVVAEIATVFAFAEETDCIVATKVYYEDEFDIRIP